MFIDANIFIIATLGRDNRSQRCREFLSKVQSGEQKSVTSILVFSEVLKVIGLRIGHKKALSEVRKLMQIPNLTIDDISHQAFEDSFEFFAKDMLPMDAFHLAIMKKHNVLTILSYDKDFDLVKGVKRIEP